MNYRGAGVGSFNVLASIMSAVENTNPALNNPGALIYAGQPGASPSSQTFVGSDGRTYAIAQFDSLADGQAAQQAQIALDASRGLTIEQFANKYAPAGNGNDPAAYAQQIAAAMGLSVNDPLYAAADPLDSTGAAPFELPGLPSDFASSLGLASSFDPSWFLWPALIGVFLWLVFSRKQ